MSVYDRVNFNLSRIPEREDMFMPNRPPVIDAPLSNVAQPPVFNQLTPEQQLALQNFQNPAPAQIDLGGGLGGFTMPQITLDKILANMPQGIFGYQPPVIEQPPVVEPEAETVETGLEDTGVSDEVVEDVVDTTSDYPFTDPETGGDLVLVVGDPTNPGPGVVVRDPETGELPPGFSDEGVDGPAGTVVEGPYIAPPPPSVFSEPSPTIVDGGITTATPVVDDRNLITPNVEVPEGSMTGLGSYFTAPQIDQIVDPGYSRPATTDMDRLLQMQRQTYGNFLYAPTPAPAPAPSPDTGTAPSEGDVGSGYVGTDYTTVPTDTTARDYIDQLYNDPTGIQFGVGDVQNQMNMNPYQFNNIGGYYTAYNPAQDMRNGILNNIYNRGYGVMDFPVFSGITSLVPSDARATIGR
jgi:hypothetical protein